MTFRDLSVDHENQSRAFVADSGNNRVVEVTAAGVQRVLPFTGLSDPTAVAVDAAGDVYVGGVTDGNVTELTTQGQQLELDLDQYFVRQVLGLSIDAAGDLFVNDGIDVLERQGSTWIKAAQHPDGEEIGGVAADRAGFLLSGQGIAVDAAGDLFYTLSMLAASSYSEDTGQSQVYQLTAAQLQQEASSGAFSSPTEVSFSGIPNPIGDIATDAAGDVFVADPQDDQVAELPRADGSPASPLPFQGLSGPDCCGRQPGRGALCV